MIKDLVSVITPCYNLGQYVYRLLDSILAQDYPFIEMFIIDDGSTDNSSDVIKSYICKFKQKGYQLTYVYQENQGVASTINNGLKLLNGEFIAWPDADDWYHRIDAISIFVNKFRELSDDYGVVRCLPTLVREGCTDIVSCRDPIHFKSNQFLNCLYGYFYWSPGNYLIRSEILDRVNPERELYIPKKGGQNRQILLPILYRYKLYTINDSLHSVLERSNSMSRKLQSYNIELSMIDGYEETIVGTLNRMCEIPNNEKKEYLRHVHFLHLQRRLVLSNNFKKRDDLKMFLEDFKCNNYTKNFKYYIFKIAAINSITYRIFHSIRKIVH